MFLNIGIDKGIMEEALNGDLAAQKVYRQAVKVAEAKASLSAAKALVSLLQEEEVRLLNAYNRANGGVILPPEYIEGDEVMAAEHQEKKANRQRVPPPPRCGGYRHRT